MVVYDRRMDAYRKVVKAGDREWVVLTLEGGKMKKFGGAFVTGAPVKDLRPLTKREKGTQ